MFEHPDLNHSWSLRAAAHLLPLAPQQAQTPDVTSGDIKIERPLLSFVIIVHLFIIALAILGNAIIIYLVAVNIQLRNARNAFMLNLTFSNILLVTICTPSFLVSISSRGWHMGTFWCKCLHSIQIVIVLVSAFSIAMIAVDRWIFVVYARSHQLKTHHVACIVVGIWALAILLSVPTFIIRSTGQLYDESLFNIIKDLKSKMNGFMSSNPHNLLAHFNVNATATKDDSSKLNPYAIPPSSGKILHMQARNDWDILAHKMSTENPIYCFETWPHPIYKRIYILVLFVLEFVLPCLVMLVTYIWIVRFLKAQDDKMNHYELLRKRLMQKERQHQKSCKILSVLCVTFIICCLPLSFFNIKSEFDVNKYFVTDVNADQASKEKEIYSSLTLLTTLEELNAILSPLLYGWLNHNFRNAINERLTLFKNGLKKSREVKNHHSHFNKPQLLATV